MFFRHFNRYFEFRLAKTADACCFLKKVIDKFDIVSNELRRPNMVCRKSEDLPVSFSGITPNIRNFCDG